jgi:hypothetical protein
LCTLQLGELDVRLVPFGFISHFAVLFDESKNRLPLFRVTLWAMGYQPRGRLANLIGRISGHGAADCGFG